MARLRFHERMLLTGAAVELIVPDVIQYKKRLYAKLQPADTELPPVMYTFTHHDVTRLCSMVGTAHHVLAPNKVKSNMTAEMAALTTAARLFACHVTDEAEINRQPEDRLMRRWPDGTYRSLTQLGMQTLHGLIERELERENVQHTDK
jgi:hypothetical protein